MRTSVEKAPPVLFSSGPWPSAREENNLWSGESSKHHGRSRAAPAVYGTLRSAPSSGFGPSQPPRQCHGRPRVMDAETGDESAELPGPQASGAGAGPGAGSELGSSCLPAPRAHQCVVPLLALSLLLSYFILLSRRGLRKLCL